MVSSLLSTTVAWLGLMLSSSALPADIATRSGPPTAGTITTIHKFPNGTWIENLAVRSNGGVLLTELSAPRVVYIDPFSSNTNPSVLARFPAPATAAIGITEMEPDVFYVGTAQVNITTIAGTPGTGQIWRINMTNYPNVAPPTLVANITGSGLINGLTALPATNKILVADTRAGVIWRVDTKSHAVDVASNGTVLHSNPQSCAGLVGGVNGIHAVPQKNVVYFSNIGSCTFGRIPIDANGSQTGKAVILYRNNNTAPDDFALAQKYPDAAFLTDESAGNRIVYTAGTSNSFSSIANIQGPTSAAFGRRPGDENSLYITSTGGSANYSMTPVPVGGSFTRIQLKNY